MSGYTNADYTVRNRLVGDLRWILDKDTPETRQEVAWVLEEDMEQGEKGLAHLAEFLRKTILILARQEEFKGKSEMAIFHISREEIQKIYDDLRSVDMEIHKIY